MMYFLKGEDGYKPTPLHFMLALLLVFALSWVPDEGHGAELINVLPPDYELTAEQEWYLVRDVCYEDAVRMTMIAQFPEEQISYAGTSGLRRVVFLEKLIYQCDNMLAEQADTYKDWLDHTYRLIFERYDVFIERRSQLYDSSESFGIGLPGSEELDDEHYL